MKRRVPKNGGAEKRMHGEKMASETYHPSTGKTGRASLPPLLFFTLICWGLILLSGMSASAQASGDKTLVILHTTDEHSYLLGVGPEADDYPPSALAGDGKIKGGAGRRGTILDRERALAMRTGSEVLTFSSGDNMMGTLFEAASLKAAPDYRVMKALKYDAGTFGNHDFELSPAFLAATIARATSSGGMFPIVATNTHFSENDPRDAALKALFDDTGKDPKKPIKRYLVFKTRRGLKVGVVGVLGAHAAYDAPGKAPVRFSLGASGNEKDFEGAIRALCDELQPVVDHLRGTEKVDVVVALGHTGTDPDRPGVGESFDIARTVAGIDVFLSGHTHLRTPPTIVKNKKTGKKVILIESGRYGDTIGKIVLSVARDGSVSFDIKNCGLIPVDSTVPSSGKVLVYLDQAISALESKPERPDTGKSMLERTISTILEKEVKHDKKRVGSLYFMPLGKTRVSMTESFKAQESRTARLVSDAFLHAGRTVAGPTDVSVVVGGFLRDGVWRGQKEEISFADIFRILPLGQDPTSPGLEGYTPGFPIVRFGMNVAEFKGILDATIVEAFASAEGGDYFAVASGLGYEFDRDRPAFDPKDPRNQEKGQVTKVTVPSDPAFPDRLDKVIYDRSTGGWRMDPTKSFFTVVADYNLAVFLLKMGVHPVDPASMKPLTPETLSEAVVRRPDGSQVKGYEALASYIYKVCSEGDGYLSERYASTNPERAVCKGAKCVGAKAAGEKEGKAR
jgi:5'-nucleotidase